MTDTRRVVVGVTHQCRGRVVVVSQSLSQVSVTRHSVSCVSCLVSPVSSSCRVRVDRHRTANEPIGSDRIGSDTGMPASTSTVDQPIKDALVPIITTHSAVQRRAHLQVPSDERQPAVGARRLFRFLDQTGATSPRCESDFPSCESCNHLQPKGPEMASTSIQTVVSIRLDPQTLQRLQDAADGAGRSRSAHALNLIRAGLSGVVPSVPDDVHPLVAETLAVFQRVEGPDVRARLEGALVLARVAAAGGAPATAAVRALNLIFDEIDTLTADDTFGADISIPREIVSMQ
jgi:hypothetical protein